MDKNKIIKWLILAIALLLILVCIAFGKVRNQNREIHDYYNVNQSLVAILQQTKNQLGQETTKRESLQLSNSRLLLALNTKDSTMLKLQSLVKEYEKNNKQLRNAIVMLNSTIVKYEDSIKNIIIDQVVIGDTVYHTYRKDINMFDKWITGNVTLGINQFDINLDVYNEYGVTLYSERPSLFKPRVGYVDIINYNPYTTTHDIRNYEVVIPKCNFIVPFGVGGAVGIATSFLIYKALR